jgi:hypothetical protein
VIKSRIVLAVARSLAGGDPAAALAELDAAGDDAQRVGLLPLVWPARAAAADLLERAGAGASTADERSVGVAERSTITLSGDAPRRRRAEITTLSVIERRCDPVGRLLMGEQSVVDARHRVT